MIAWHPKISCLIGIVVIATMPIGCNDTMSPKKAAASYFEQLNSLSARYLSATNIEDRIKCEKDVLSLIDEYRKSKAEVDWNSQEAVTHARLAVLYRLVDSKQHELHKQKAMRLFAMSKRAGMRMVKDWSEVHDFVVALDPTLEGVDVTEEQNGVRQKD